MKLKVEQRKNSVILMGMSAMLISKFVKENRAGIVQNLIDADCPPELISEFMEKAGSAKEKQARQILEQHRRKLLERVHREEGFINRLDYLLYSLGR